MSDQHELEERLEVIEKRLKRTRRCLAIAAVVLAIVWWPHNAPEAPAEVVVGNTVIDGEGIITSAYHPNQFASLDVQRGPRLQLIGAHTTLDLSVPTNGYVASASFFSAGGVTSQVLIDTRTGEWRLRRFREDSSGKAIDTEEIQLVAPLADPHATGAGSGR